MKKVIYYGKEYEVPNWTRFIATDEDGEIYAFDTRPNDCSDGVWGVYRVDWVDWVATAEGEEDHLCEMVGQKEGGSSSWGDSLVEIE